MKRRDHEVSGVSGGPIETVGLFASKAAFPGNDLGNCAGGTRRSVSRVSTPIHVAIGDEDEV